MKLRRQHFILYPELAMFPSDEERLTAIKTMDKEIRRRMWRSPFMWLMYIVYGALMMLAVKSSTGLANRFAASLPIRLFLSSLPAMLLGIGFGLGFQYAWLAPMQKALRKALVSKGIAICLRCGYSLTGNVSGVCPECGAAITQPDPAAR